MSVFSLYIFPLLSLFLSISSSPSQNFSFGSYLVWDLHSRQSSQPAPFGQISFVFSSPDSSLFFLQYFSSSYFSSPFLILSSAHYCSLIALLPLVTVCFDESGFLFCCCRCCFSLLSETIQRVLLRQMHEIPSTYLPTTTCLPTQITLPIHIQTSTMSACCILFWRYFFFSWPCLCSSSSSSSLSTIYL